MRFRELYTNPEVKSLTKKCLIITFLGIILLALSSFVIYKNVCKVIINQNSSIMASVLNEESSGDIIKNFYKLKSDEEIANAREVLSEFGYNKNISLASNEVGRYILKQMLIIDIPLFMILFIIIYFLYIKELKNIYVKIHKIILSSKAIYSGEYKNIDGNYEEGEMAVLVSSINFMGDRVNNSIELLKKDKEDLKDFLSDISHQLKTPLASLVMFNDLMRENEDMPYEDRVNFLDRSEEQLRRMEWLIMNLLKVGRIEANAINFEMEVRPLKETIDLAVSSLREEVKMKNQHLIIKGKVEAEVLHDKEWLAEAISNIVKNAIEHTEEDGTIEINVEQGKLITKIFIRDNGVGIPKEMQKNVFKRFYKGENSRNPKSIGIGLSLAKSIVEKQGGEIKLFSEINKGTTFVITFIK